MLQSVYLGGFKGFNATQRIPIRPITLLFGPNSGGKSSVLHSLLFAKTVMTSGNPDVRLTQTGGDSVDLGGFEQFVHGNRVEWGMEVAAQALQELQLLCGPKSSLGIRVTIGRGLFQTLEPIAGTSCFRWGATPELREPGSGDSLAYGSSSYEMGSPLVGRPDVQGVELLLDGEVALRLVRESKKGSEFKVLFAGLDQPWFENTVAALTSKPARRKIAAMAEAVRSVFPAMRVRMGTLLPEAAYLRRTDCASLAELVALRPKGISKYRIPKAGGKAVALPGGFFQRLLDAASQERKDLLPLAKACVAMEDLAVASYAVSALAAELLKDLRYLGPIRTLPPRHYFSGMAGTDQDYSSGGIEAIDIISRNPAVLTRINTWLSSPSLLHTKYKFVRHDYFLFDAVLEALTQLKILELDGKRGPRKKDFLEQLEELGGNKKRSSLRLEDLRTRAIVDFCDVGTGLSQVLPVLVRPPANVDHKLAGSM